MNLRLGRYSALIGYGILVLAMVIGFFQIQDLYNKRLEDQQKSSEVRFADQQRFNDAICEEVARNAQSGVDLIAVLARPTPHDDAYSRADEATKTRIDASNRQKQEAIDAADKVIDPKPCADGKKPESQVKKFEPSPG